MMVKTYGQIRYAANREARVAASLKWARDNKERYRKNQAAWRDKNRAKIKSHNTEYNLSHKSEIKTIREHYYQTIRGWAVKAMNSITQRSTEKYEQGKQKHKRRTVSITKDDLMALWAAQDGRCAITKQPMDLAAPPYSPTRPSVDRIDNSRGYHRDNVRLIWLFCQLGRSRWDDAQFVACCKVVTKANP